MIYEFCKGEKCPYFNKGNINLCAVRASDKIRTYDESPFIVKTNTPDKCSAMVDLEKSVEYHIMMSKFYESIIEKINIIS